MTHAKQSCYKGSYDELKKYATEKTELKMKDLTEYIDFKIKQFIRTTGFDIKQPNAKAVLSSEIKPKLKNWVMEAKQAGIKGM